MTAALANGGTDHFGWGVDRHLAADLYDAINVNTKVSGNWKTKPPDIPEWPRPHTTSAETAAPAPISVADIYKRFTRR